MNRFDYQQGLEPCWYFYAISDNKNNMRLYHDDL